MKNRIGFAKYLNSIGCKKGAEIGVADGRYSEILCKENKLLQLFCVDPYTTYEGSWRTKEHQDKTYHEVQKRLYPYKCRFIRKSSIEASFDVLDNYLDFVFIDGGHSFNDVIVDIVLWSKKVKKGGIISGHDYCYFKNSGVIEAVNAYCENNKIELNIISRDKTAYKDDRQPCWWFVKK